MRSPMRFFETTPIGTILNRFSRDIYVIDEVLARTFGGFARTIAGVFSMIAVISSSVPAFLLVLIPVLFVYKRIQTCVLAVTLLTKRSADVSLHGARAGTTSQPRASSSASTRRPRVPSLRRSRRRSLAC